jgi:hypothetical protein
MAINHGALIAFVTDHTKRAKFNGRIAELEGICRGNPPVTNDTPEPESREWYIKEILSAIAAVRHWLANGQPEIAAAEALVVGMLAARAGALQWPAMQKWNAHLEALSRGRKEAAETNRVEAATRNAALARAVAACRKKHPQSSINHIAQLLVREFGNDSGDSKRDLAALAKRISRLPARK